MSLRLFVAAALLFFASCEWETHEFKEGDVQIYVQEKRFIALKPGSTAEDVAKAIGLPRRKEGSLQETWHYGVWRGDSPGLFNRLFSSRTSFTLLEGQVRFASGRVTQVQVIESSAVTYPPPKTRS